MWEVQEGGSVLDVKIHYIFIEGADFWTQKMQSVAGRPSDESRLEMSVIHINDI
jgi:hypothetical protein